MKLWYDKKAKLSMFKVDGKVLVLVPLQNHTLQARYCDPYLVSVKVNDVNYVISTTYRQKSWHLCYVNVLKPYREKAQAQGRFTSNFNGSSGKAGTTLVMV